jgi:hypothetical protein
MRGKSTKPTLVVRTGREGVQRVVVRYDAGDEPAAFSLFERAFGAIQELDRVIRSGSDCLAPVGAPPGGH